MTKSFVLSVKSLVFTSKNPEKLAKFYTDVAGLPFEKEQHHGGRGHWACRLESVHLAIHYLDNFNKSNLDSTSPNSDLTRITFTIGNLDEFMSHLKHLNIELIEPVFEIGPMKFLAIRDPDGRAVYFGTPWVQRQTPNH
jgi:catechol 2,3-dioxygenase-like lactoylglutathione lyase family enzyme